MNSPNLVYVTKADMHCWVNNGLGSRLALMEHRPTPQFCQAILQRLQMKLRLIFLQPFYPLGKLSFADFIWMCVNDNSVSLSHRCQGETPFLIV